MASRNADSTRDNIVSAAIAVFSTVGYAAAGVREIGARAGANPALVNRYFGSKLGLFRTALDTALAVERITELGRKGLASRLADSFIDPGEGAFNPLPMIVFAAADPDAQAIAQAALEQRIVVPLGVFIGGPDGETRAARLMAIATGFFTYRILYPLAPFAGPVSANDRRWLEISFENALSG